MELFLPKNAIPSDPQNGIPFSGDGGKTEYFALKRNFVLPQNGIPFSGGKTELHFGVERNTVMQSQRTLNTVKLPYSLFSKLQYLAAGSMVTKSTNNSFLVRHVV